MSNILLTRSPYRQHYLQAPVRRRLRFGQRVSAIPRLRSLKNVKFEFGPFALIVTLLLIAVLISSIYLMHFNKVATKGYDLRKLEASRQELLSQHSIKDSNLAEVKSLNSMLQSGRLDHMRKPSEIIFVRGDTAIASR